MTSKIVVNNIEADVGVNTVTISGDITATNVTGTHHGSAANLTNVPAANITGTLPAISAANLTNLPAANITGTLPAISAANLTNVPAANITGTLPAISGANLTGISAPLSFRNLIINGAMQVAQHGTSSTSQGYQTVDRFKIGFSGTDEAPTQSQISLTSSDTGPFETGFRKALRITNGNQTSGLGANDYMFIETQLESQDIANSGWDYTSSSSYLSLSFWVRSSVAREIGGYMRNFDGTAQKQTFTTGNVSANTWTKKTLLISGDSDLEFADDNTAGYQVQLRMSYGSTYTSGSANLGSWVDYASGDLGQDGALGNDTWYTTNDATYDITGVQLEVGSSATTFEHRSFAEELQRCKRYYQIVMQEGNGHERTGGLGGTPYSNGNSVYCPYTFPVQMRVKPTIESTASGTFRTRLGNQANFNGFSGFNDGNNHSGTFITVGNAGGGNVGQFIWIETNSGAKLALNAEL